MAIASPVRLRVDPATTESDKAHHSLDAVVTNQLLALGQQQFQGSDTAVHDFSPILRKLPSWANQTGQWQMHQSHCFNTLIVSVRAYLRYRFADDHWPQLPRYWQKQTVDRLLIVSCQTLHSFPEPEAFYGSGLIQLGHQLHQQTGWAVLIKDVPLTRDRPEDDQVHELLSALSQPDKVTSIADRHKSPVGRHSRQWHFAFGLNPPPPSKWQQLMRP